MIPFMLMISLFQPDSFTAALGGGLSLFLGVALILLFEIVELGYDVFMAVWKHTNKIGGV